MTLERPHHGRLVSLRIDGRTRPLLPHPTDRQPLVWYASHPARASSSISSSLSGSGCNTDVGRPTRLITEAGRTDGLGSRSSGRSCPGARWNGEGVFLFLYFCRRATSHRCVDRRVSCSVRAALGREMQAECFMRACVCHSLARWPRWALPERRLPKATNRVACCREREMPSLGSGRRG